jgi:hypothetical protein
MQERTIGTTSSQDRTASKETAARTRGQTTSGGQTTVPASLLDAVMDVDAAVDDGGLELQEALARMHEELAHIIPGPAGDAGARRSSQAPASPEASSART